MQQVASRVMQVFMVINSFLLPPLTHSYSLLYLFFRLAVGESLLPKSFVCKMHFAPDQKATQTWPMISFPRKKLCQSSKYIR